MHIAEAVGLYGRQRSGVLVDLLGDVTHELANYPRGQLDAGVLLLVQLGNTPFRFGDDLIRQHAVSGGKMIEQGNYRVIHQGVPPGWIDQRVGLAAKMHRAALAIRRPEPTREQRENEVDVMALCNLECGINVWKEHVVKAGDEPIRIELQAMSAVAENSRFHDADALGGHVGEIGVDLAVGGRIAHARVSPSTGAEVLPRLPRIIQASPESRMACCRQAVSWSGRSDLWNDRRHRWNCTRHAWQCELTTAEDEDGATHDRGGHCDK